jgi:DNA modification methylase
MAELVSQREQVRMAERIEVWPVDRLIPYEKNARTHSDAQVLKIAASITEFGFTNPVLVDGAAGIIAGHGRLLAAKRLGMESVPVIELTHLSDKQKRAYLIADNRLAEDAGWDEERLAEELIALNADGFDLALTGFSTAELDALLVEDLENDPDADASDAADDVPDAPIVPLSRLGDVWVIGPHRLLCGSAADQTALAALMQGDCARLCVTSPPYGNQRDYMSGGIGDWDGLMRGVFSALPMTQDGQVLVNLGMIHRDHEVIPYWDHWVSWMRSQGWRRFGWYIWDQGPGMPGDFAGRLAPSFEFIFHFNRESRPPNKIIPCKYAGQAPSGGGMRRSNGEAAVWSHSGQPTQENRIPDSVIRVMRHKGKIGDNIDHPAVFPVALPEFIIESYSAAADLIFEPFGGSGTTMLAAHRLGRVCRSCEIAPQYVDVAVKRFQQNNAGVPVTLMATGQSFAAIAEERGA